MDLTPRGIIAFARTDDGRKWVKYSAVSVVGMTVSQICIIVLYRGMGVPKLLTNFLAVTISSIPAYLLNRAWVWGKHGKNHLFKEVIPFWGFSIAGLVLSMGTVALIAPDQVPGQTASAMDTFRVMIGNIAGFGILWVGKFFAFDKLVFGSGVDDDDPTEPDRDLESPVPGVEGPSLSRG